MKRALIAATFVAVGGAVIFLLVQMASVGKDGVGLDVKEANANCKGGSAGCFPAIALVDHQGKRHTPSSLTGKPVVVKFWATTCKQCLAEAALLNRYYQTNKDRLQVLIIMAGATPAEISRQAQELGLEMPVIPASKAILEAWGNPSRFPAVYLYDKDGILAKEDASLSGVALAEAVDGLDSPRYPGIDMTDLNGAVYTQKSLAGKVVVVNFWATWCKPCLREIPALAKYYSENKAKGLEIIGVLNEDGVPQERIEAFTSRTGLNFPVVVFDDAVMQAWQYPSRLPTTFVYDRKGKLAREKVGALSEPELDELLGKLLAEPAN